MSVSCISEFHQFIMWFIFIFIYLTIFNHHHTRKSLGDAQLTQEHVTFCSHCTIRVHLLLSPAKLVELLPVRAVTYVSMETEVRDRRITYVPAMLRHAGLTADTRRGSCWLSVLHC